METDQMKYIKEYNNKGMRAIEIDKVLYTIVKKEFEEAYNKIAEEKKELSLYKLTKKNIVEYENILTSSKQDSEENDEKNERKLNTHKIKMRIHNLNDYDIKRLFKLFYKENVDIDKETSKKLRKLILGALQIIYISVAEKKSNAKKDILEALDYYNQYTDKELSNKYKKISFETKDYGNINFKKIDLFFNSDKRKILSEMVSIVINNIEYCNSYIKYNSYEYYKKYNEVEKKELISNYLIGQNYDFKFAFNKIKQIITDLNSTIKNKDIYEIYEYNKLLEELNIKNNNIKNFNIISPKSVLEVCEIICYILIIIGKEEIKNNNIRLDKQPSFINEIIKHYNSQDLEKLAQYIDLDYIATDYVENINGEDIFFCL